jgi:hypothetical protein
MLLHLTLQTAVPLHIEEVRKWTPEQRIAYCHEHADTIASRSDDLMYGSRKKGEVAKLFNVLARALACLAFQPGGARFGELRWEAEPRDPPLPPPPPLPGS